MTKVNQTEPKQMFAMVEKLIESNNNLSTLVKDKHQLLKKAALKVADIRDKVAAQDGLEFILREKIKKLLAAEAKIAELSERMMSVDHLQDQINYLKAAEINDGFNDAKVNTDKIRKKRRAN